MSDYTTLSRAEVRGVLAFCGALIEDNKHEEAFTLLEALFERLQADDVWDAKQAVEACGMAVLTH